jgi:hypothetical protein
LHTIHCLAVLRPIDCICSFLHSWWRTWS